MSRSRPRRSKPRRQFRDVTPRCPTPRKLGWSTRESAEECLQYFAYQHAPKRPVRVYECRCGQFHHTSRPAWGTDA